MFVELYSTLNVLHYVHKMNLCQSDIMKLETSHLSYYWNTAKISQQSLYYKNQQVKLYHHQQLRQTKPMSVLQLEDSGLKDK